MAVAKTRLLSGVALAAGLLGPAVPALADGFVNLSIVARPQNSSGAFTNQLTVNQGATYEYQVVGTMGPVGTANSNFGGNATKSITSLSSGGTAGQPATYTYSVDGVNNLKFNLIESNPNSAIRLDLPAAGGLNASPVPAGSSAQGTGWNAGTGASGGTPTARANGGNDLIGVRPIHAAGVFTIAEGPEVILAGTFTVPSAPAGAASVTLTGQYFTGAILAGKVNGGTSFVPNNTTETGADPYVKFQSLTLSTVPEPASAGLLGLAAAGLLARRRRAAPAA